MYKRKGRKTNPVNTSLQEGINPGGNVMMEVIGNESLEEEMQGGGRKVPRGSRFTPERLAQMKIGGGMLSKEEKQLFIDILFEHEGAIAFDDSEMGLLNPEIEPPVKIHTVPHSPLATTEPPVTPKAMQQEATRHVHKKLELGILEFSQGPYRSRYFLVGKEGQLVRGSSTMCRPSTKSQFETPECLPLLMNSPKISLDIPLSQQLTITPDITKSPLTRIPETLPPSSQTLVLFE